MGNRSDSITIRNLLKTSKMENKKRLVLLVGQVMKASKGQANPQMVNKLIVEELNKL